MQTITASELKTKLNQSTPVDLIDVRTPAEHKAVHVKGCRLTPLDQLDAQAITDSRPPKATGPTYILCKAGTRAAKAAKQLQRHNLDCVVVEGGTDACISAGLDCKHGKQVMSLERQVRIAAGSLVLIGTLLAAFLHPAFLILPGFVGTGLIFAGITNTCGMGLLLLKCPWNQ